ncbi:MAG: PDZ domain-containing protein [Woeseiaceae bacterium]|nr:PDZ domain-containing protein [Woeseiaceae bacterium]
MTIRNPALILGVVAAAGLASAAIVLQSGEPGAAPPTAADPGLAFDQAASTRERLAALEAAVAEERRARQLLEDELLALYDELDRLGPAPRGAEPVATNAEGEQPTGPSRAELRERRTRFETSAEARTEALLAAGFTPDRAEWIRQREDELRVAAMQARFDAQRAGDMQAMFQAEMDSAAALRQELGDAEYEQYLEAMGRPTAVRVGNVLESSPGQAAGLRRGDEIVRYDGLRVFSYTDLNRQQLEGAAGESVVVDILRDGVPMQVVLPRGPIGIEAQRRWRQ